MGAKLEEAGFDPHRKASRLPPLPRPLDPIVASLFENTLSRGGDILNLHLTNGQAPRLARARRVFTIALRDECACPRLDREIAICRAALLVDCAYEWGHHLPLVKRAGLSEEQARALADWRGSASLFEPRHQALLAFVDQMCERKGVVEEAAFAELQTHYSPQEIVELANCASTYYATGLYMKALGLIPDEPGRKAAPGSF